MKKRVLGIVAASAFAVATFGGTALADVGDERAGEPGCNGRILAVFNQNSGTNENDARGPGFFFRDGQAVKDAINNLARPNCEVPE